MQQTGDRKPSTQPRLSCQTAYGGSSCPHKSSGWVFESLPLPSPSNVKRMVEEKLAWSVASTEQTSSGTGHSRGSGWGSMWKRRGLVIWMTCWCMKLTKHWFEMGQSKFLMTYSKCLVLVVLLKSFPQLLLQSSTVILSNRNSEKSFRLSHYACAKSKRTEVWEGFPPTTLT